MKKTIREGESAELESEADVTRSKRLKSLMEDASGAGSSGGVKPEDEGHVKMMGHVNDLRSVHASMQLGLLIRRWAWGGFHQPPDEEALLMYTLVLIMSQ